MAKTSASASAIRAKASRATANVSANASVSTNATAARHRDGRAKATEPGRAETAKAAKPGGRAEAGRCLRLD